MIGLDLFPTKFFEIQLDTGDAFNLLKEIMRKEDEIKIISSTRQIQSIEEYATDFSYQDDSKVVKLENLEKVFNIIKNEFDKNNSLIEVIDYWTAIYLKTGYHGLHTHKNNILDKCNYSGIIYLSDLGGTTFYSPSLTSFESNFVSKSEMGKILIFPSNVPHAVNATLVEENKRYIVSFNCEIRNK